MAIAASASPRVRTAVLVRAVAAAAALFVLAHLHLRWRPATLCPLRAVTGIPCPLCGSTTAAVRLGRLDLLGALRAAPVTVAAGVALLAAPLGAARLWWRLPGPTRHAIVLTALGVAEVWQLVRFGLL